jgi:hypothetical protein
MTNPNKQNVRRTRITTYVNQQELDKIRKKVASSTCHGLSEYSWKLLMGEPVTFYTRNKSFDDFVSEGVRIRREIQLIRSSVPLSGESEHRLVDLIGGIYEQLKSLSDYVYQDKNKQKHRSQPTVPRTESGPETGSVYRGGELPEGPA